MHAPGHPGIPPTWTSSAKDAVGTTLGPSRVWFTLGYGILNEVYWPRTDSPQIRDLGFIVADDRGFWSEVKRDSEYTIDTPGAGIPAYTVVHRHPRYTLTMKITTDPVRDVVVLHCQLDGDADLRLYALLAPHLGDSGLHNTAQVLAYRGALVLAAENQGLALALAARGTRNTPAFTRGSAGFVGVSDGWQDFDQHGRMTWVYDRAADGNVALLGEIDGHEATLALGFGDSLDLAATLASASLERPFPIIWDDYAGAWSSWLSTCPIPATTDPAIFHAASISAAVLKVHEDRAVPGALVASLSIPWGQSRSDIGGYHLVWSRDLVEAAGGLLAIDAAADAARVLAYLMALQHQDGHWSQNQWLSGASFWNGVQLDEVGFPILLAERLRELRALGGMNVAPMVRRAATFIACNGPVTGQDRWEENAGLNPFTLAVDVAALVCAANFLDGPARDYALELADAWNARIEDWTYVSGTDLARQHGVSGYYVRIAPPEVASGAAIVDTQIPIKNQPPESTMHPTAGIVSLDFLELVRLGLRRADDPRIRDTVTVTDALLKVDTPAGPGWHRYNEDGYGEHADGSPYDGTGIGRAWPLLTGERGHYALAAGADPEPYLRTMIQMASPGGMLPEQVWDSDDLPARHLWRGRPSGSAMPLVWTHAELLKLVVSMLRGYPFDRPTPVWERYHGEVPTVPWLTWRLSQRTPAIPAGACLRLELLASAVVHWSTDDWQTTHDTATRDTTLGIHLADLPSDAANPGGTIRFTFKWQDNGQWQGENYAVGVTG